jgi:hypothetical protein
MRALALGLVVLALGSTGCNCTEDIRLAGVTSTIADQAAYANEDQIAVWAMTFAK